MKGKDNMTKEALETKEFTQKDLDEIAKHVKGILKVIDPNPEREGIRETPQRVAKAYAEMLEGQLYTNDEIAEKFTKVFNLNDKECDDEDVVTQMSPTLGKNLVIAKNINVFSMCEHHLALMYDMNITIAYIPNKKVIGLSKMARIADLCAKRLQLQEKLGEDICKVMQLATDTEDVAVLISGKHSCMTARGIRAREAETVTSHLKGRFMDNATLRSEFLTLCQLKD